MSKETPIEAKDTKILKVITEVLKKCALQTVSVVESTTGNIKYDNDIYHHSGLDLSKAEDKKTAVDIKRSKKDPDGGKGADGKDKKIIVAEKIPRKAVLNFNTRLKQMLCAVFAQYASELATCIGECQSDDNELSLKKDKIIGSLLEMASMSDNSDQYHYLPLILTLYNENVVNSVEETSLKMLKSSIERSKSGLGDILLDAYDNLFVNHGEIKDICVKSYLYLIALFSMETATRVWVEAKVPKADGDDSDSDDDDDDDDDSKKKKKKKKVKIPLDEQATKLISTKTIDLNAYKTFMLNKMQGICVCSKSEYDYIIDESDAIVASIEADLDADKKSRKIDKDKTKADTAARNANKTSASVKKTARDTEDDAVPPGAGDDEEDEAPKKKDPKTKASKKKEPEPEPEENDGAKSDDPGSEEEEPKKPVRKTLGGRGGRK
jgi:hypothetical protein